MKRLRLGLWAVLPLVMAHAAVAQPVEFDADQFGKIVVAPTQSAGGGGLQLEQAFGDYQNEPVITYGENSIARKLGRAVGRLDTLYSNGKTGYCTAFIVDDTHIVTNNHCIPGVNGVGITAAQFVAGYVQPGQAAGAERYSVDVTPVETSKSLDYTVLRVFGDPSAKYGTVKLAADDAEDAEFLWIIGHPQGQSQHISREGCAASEPSISDEGKLVHSCDTLGGNSGSPVFRITDRHVIGLHHAGDSRTGFNYAIPMKRILDNSQVLKAAVTAPLVSAETQACDALWAASQGHGCVGYTAYLNACPNHAVRPLAEQLAKTACEAEEAAAKRAAEAAKRAEEARLAEVAKRAEEARLAQTAKQEEARRQAEADRLARQAAERAAQADADRLAKADADRAAQDLLAAERAEADRLAAAAAAAEAERLALAEEQRAAEAARLEAERLAAAKRAEQTAQSKPDLAKTVSPLVLKAVRTQMQTLSDPLFTQFDDIAATARELNALVSNAEQALRRAERQFGATSTQATKARVALRKLASLQVRLKLTQSRVKTARTTAEKALQVAASPNVTRPDLMKGLRRLEKAAATMETLYTVAAAIDTELALAPHKTGGSDAAKPVSPTKVVLPAPGTELVYARTRFDGFIPMESGEQLVHFLDAGQSDHAYLECHDLSFCMYKEFSDVLKYAVSSSVSGETRIEEIKQTGSYEPDAYALNIKTINPSNLAFFPLEDGKEIVWQEHWSGDSFDTVYDMRVTQSCCVAAPTDSVAKSKQVWRITYEYSSEKDGKGTTEMLFDPLLGWSVRETHRNEIGDPDSDDFSIFSQSTTLIEIRQAGAR